jgi:hypothetical protein
MKHVAQARESVSKAVAAGLEKEQAPRRSLDAATGPGDDDDDEVDEDLKLTLDSWLRNAGKQEQQGQHHRRLSPRCVDQEEVEEEADCKSRMFEGTATVNLLRGKMPPVLRAREEGKDAGFGEGGEVEEDDEVAALQSMLAQELLLHDRE